MRRFLESVVGVVLAAGMLAGCGTGTTAGTGSTTTQTTSAASTQTTTNGTQTTTAAGSAQTEAADTGSSADSGKVLVVYYSATGNTEAVAQDVANALDADTFEITPAEPYTSADLNWSDSSSRVSREHDDEALQDQVELTTTTVDNWDSYDTVFIGYPIWWGIAAWPVNQFVENNDFTGKTVIPFCTSSSSGLGESGTRLAAMAGTGDWQEGRRFSSSAAESEVASWAQSAAE